MYSFKGTYAKVKKEVTKKNNLTYKSHIYKIKTMTQNFYKYPSKSIHKTLNFKPVYT